MKKLISVVAMGIIFGFCSLSLGSDHMGLYTKPIMTGEVTNNASSGKIERDLMSFYLTPKKAEQSNTLWLETVPEEGNSIVVFGVRLYFDKSS